MCGRYTLSTPEDLLAELFELEEVPELIPRFNIAPTQEAPIIRQVESGGNRTMDLLRWGLVPFWSKDPSIGNRMINARAETAAEKPAFRAAFKKRRCLIAADGFYEWRAGDGPKQPFYCRLRDGRPFAIAGLWESWDKGDAPLETFTLLTTSCNELMAPIHHRMPVILKPEDFQLWLNPDLQDRPPLDALLEPYSSAEMEAYPVSTFVNRPVNDSLRCIEPAR